MLQAKNWTFRRYDALRPIQGPPLMNEHYGRLTFGQMERIMVIEKNTKLKEPEAA